jgi:shikimate kinase
MQALRPPGQYREMGMEKQIGDKNLVLIGMAGVGKSTVGVLLAKALSRRFVDTDVQIQATEGRRLQDIIDADGTLAFLAIEERAILGLTFKEHVIATGGSVVYSTPAMTHLRSNGVIVHLDLAFDLLERRITNLDSRGIVRTNGQSLRALYEERRPLYQEYADITVDCAGQSHEEVVRAVVNALENY